MAQLTLIRGIPGSGKSTLAKGLVATANDPVVHLEADMYFIEDGEYLFDATLLQNAHSWCQEACKAALEAGIDVIVSNTFIKKWEIDPYLKMKAAHIKIIEMPVVTHVNTHNVPAETIKRMKDNWETI